MSRTIFYNEETVANLVQVSLRKHTPEGKTLFRVLPKNVHKKVSPLSGDWFYVDLIAASQDLPIHRYGPMFGEVEQELEDQHGLNVLLVPMVITDAA